VYLEVCKIKPSLAVITGHAKLLSEEYTVKYPFIKTDIKTIALPSDRREYTIDNLFQNKIPNKVVVGLVSASSLSGDYKQSPFNFKTYDLNMIGLYVDGEPLPGEALSSTNYITAYDRLFEGRKNRGLDITRNDFNDGYALYVFNLETCHLKEDYLDLIKRGNLRLRLQFSTPLPETVSCILYSEDNLMLEVDEARNILYTSP
jgi:hypothetical protein